MFTYELINPSDKILFDAPSDEIAFLCSLMVGGGAYPATRQDNGKSIGGIYIFGFPEGEMKKNLGMALDEFIPKHREEINACFQSFRYVYERSSINRIVDKAHGIKIKAKEKEESPK